MSVTICSSAPESDAAPHLGSDLAAHQKTFDTVIDHFKASSEDVRHSAAFAAGCIAVGNPDKFLPTILQLIQSDDKKRYLALQALKEVRSECGRDVGTELISSSHHPQVILHSSQEKLVEISDTLWTPLFENCQAQDEGTRNIAADCLGQLTVTNPSKYLPQLQERLSAKSRDTRATVIAAIRFTFTNESMTYDELLAPLIVEFFKLIHDEDLVSACTACSQPLLIGLSSLAGCPPSRAVLSHFRRSQQASPRPRSSRKAVAGAVQPNRGRRVSRPHRRDGSVQAQGGRRS